MVQFIPSRNTYGEIGESFGQGASQGYQNRSDEMALQKAIHGLAEDATPQQIIQAVTGTRTYSPDRKQEAIKNLMGAKEFEQIRATAKANRAVAEEKNSIDRLKQTIIQDKNKAESDKEKAQESAKLALVDKLKLPDEEKEAAKGLSVSAVEDLYKHQKKESGKPGELSPFAQAVQKKNAEEYINLTKEIPLLENTVQDIAHVEDLADTLGAFNINWLGPISGLVGTEQAKELEAASFPLIQPIVKIFNPSGPIATQKLKIIQDKYQIKSTDTPPAIRGKIAALKRFGKQALNRAQERMKLLEKYDGNPPPKDLEDFDKQSDTMSDAMMDYDVVGEEVSIPGFPKADKANKGRTIVGTDGTKYTSDGTRWVKK